MAQKGSKKLQKLHNGPKRLQSVPTLHQTTPKPLKTRYIRCTPTQWLFQASPHDAYRSGTLQGLSKAPQYPSGTTPFPKKVTPSRCGRPKQALEGPKKPYRPYCLIFSSKKGQNGSKRCPNGSKYSQNRPKLHHFRSLWDPTLTVC